MTLTEPHDVEKAEKRLVIASGNAELDSKMGGGIPVGSLVLVEGDSGSGKSVLNQQILHGALNDNFVVTLFTSENTVKSLVTQMRSIDLDILDFLLLGKLRVYPIQLSRLGEEASVKLIQAVQQEAKRDLLIIDSFTSAISHSTTQAQILGFFEETKRVCAEGATIIVVLHSNVVDKDVLEPIRSLCDAYLCLRSEQDGQRLVKTLEVAKIRGATSVTGSIVGFDVEPGWGMRVIPISKARG